MPSPSVAPCATDGILEPLRRARRHDVLWCHYRTLAQASFPSCVCANVVQDDLRGRVRGASLCLGGMCSAGVFVIGGMLLTLTAAGSTLAKAASPARNGLIGFSAQLRSGI